MKLSLILAAVLFSSFGWSQEDPAGSSKDDLHVSQASGEVSITSRGNDVRTVLFDLFTQAKKNFVLEPNIHFALYLALTGVEFDEALAVVCSTADLKYELNNGIYFISKLPERAVGSAKPIETPVAPKPLGKLADRDLAKRVTTKLSKADIRAVFTELQAQTGVEITVDKGVPNFRVDAYLVSTSLKYALDVVTKAAGIEYVRTDNRTILIQKKRSTN
jgi:hypothetical protein